MIWKRSWDVRTWTREDDEHAKECCEVLESCIRTGGIHPRSQEEYKRLIEAREEYKQLKQGNQDGHDVQQIIADLEQFFANKK